MNHAAVVAALRARVQATLDSVRAVASAAYDEATHAESKAENKYDTRGLEASYLAAGQAVRLASLQRVLAFLDRLEGTPIGEDGVVGEGSLVALEDEAGAVRWSFFAPDGGGIAVTVDGVEVRVVTRDAPLGAALLGAELDAGIELTEPRRQALTVVRVVGPTL